jgi:hypothetical protein
VRTATNRWTRNARGAIRYYVRHALTGRTIPKKRILSRRTTSSSTDTASSTRGQSSSAARAIGGLFPGYVRAGGDYICEQCGKRYYDHPVNLEFLGTNYIPFLAVLCDGRNVKL